jgi:AraC-like DNA-binding protein
MTLDKRIELLLQFMESDPHWDLDKLDDFAATVHISASRLRHLFRKQTGVSPSRYFKLVQLRKARFLLEHSYLLVKQVMSEVGFKDLSHAVRDYKAIYGHTPLETRAGVRCPELLPAKRRHWLEGDRTDRRANWVRPSKIVFAAAMPLEKQRAPEDISESENKFIGG